jgi:hypothetical protein
MFQRFCMSDIVSCSAYIAVYSAETNRASKCRPDGLLTVAPSLKVIVQTG